MARKHVTFENVRIGFRRFGGKATKFDKEGDRDFAMFLSEDQAVQLAEEGWNIKFPKEAESGRDPFVKVSVAYANFPPKVTLITSAGQTELTEETIEILDSAEIEKVDLSISPYYWEMNGKSGVKAYLRSMYVTLAEDELARKYRNRAPSDDDPPFIDDRP